MSFWISSDETKIIVDAYGKPIYSDTEPVAFGDGEKALLTASDAESGNRYGYAVSISGEYAIVGAYEEYYSDRGAAYIYQRTGTDTWGEETKILAYDQQSDDYFGKSVSIDGDYCIVGAYGEGSNGAAYINHRTSENTWDTGVKLVASDGASGDNFGVSVAISGDYAVVGATGDDDGGSSSGSAHIFHRTATNTWDAGVKIVASDAAVADYFGSSVAIYGDYVVVGAKWKDSDTGAAYIFHRTGTNTWDTGTKIVASDAAAGDNFGYSVGIFGDYAVVGAYKEGSSPLEAGAAYVYLRTATNTWDAGTKLVADDASANANFGASVGISNDYIIVGAPDDSSVSLVGGACYIFHRTGSNTWNTGNRVYTSSVYNFGEAADIDGNYAIAGVTDLIGDGTSHNGAAYVFK